MTIPQFQNFLKAIDKRKKVETADFLSRVALATQGDPKSVTKQVKKILDAVAKPKKMTVDPDSSVIDPNVTPQVAENNHLQAEA